MPPEIREEKNGNDGQGRREAELSEGLAILVLSLTTII